MKRFWSGKRKHIDEEKVAAEKRELAHLQRLIELGDEDNFVALIKVLRPGVSKEELKSLISQFRDQHQDYLRGAPRRP
jgi:hypothetical protein